MGMLKVEHVTILGYLEPVSAPIYALFLLGQGIALWTVIGGALIVGRRPARRAVRRARGRRAPSPLEPAAVRRSHPVTAGGRRRSRGSRAHARDANARVSDTLQASWLGDGRRRSGRARLGREPGLTILFIYSRLWPDPG